MSHSQTTTKATSRSRLPLADDSSINALLPGLQQSFRLSMCFAPWRMRLLLPGTACSISLIFSSRWNLTLELNVCSCS